MHRPKLHLAIVLIVTLVAGAHLQAESQRVLAEWRFDNTTKWNGWTPNGEIQNVSFDADGVSFDSTGNDPIIIGPQFEIAPATNNQWVVIDLECPRPGTGELFYTNTTTGTYGGFEGKWVTLLTVPAAGRQNVTVWPFWSSLSKIIRLRFDPPSGVRCKLHSIRVMGLAGDAPVPRWDFGGRPDSWASMYAAGLTRSADGLTVRATSPQAVIVTPVQPFDAARRSILRLDAACPDDPLLSVYWATTQDQGLFGQPIRLPAAGAASLVFDLREFPMWQGTVTHLALAFGTRGDETLRMRSLAIEENDAGRPFVRAKYIGFARGINRPGRAADVTIVLEHAGGPALAAGEAKLSVDRQAVCEQPIIAVPAIEPGGRVTVRGTIVPRQAGPVAVTVDLPNGQAFTRTLRIDEAIQDASVLQRPEDYDVPVPRPVKTGYQVGIYYFPGWSPDRMSTWQKQADFPERDSLLGWYEEGRPEVADWHIKWAVENGISYFVYDWYWRNGKEELAAGLDEGFLKARYNNLMKFAVMWANHRPFADHTPEQLLQVTDYWIEHYLRRPNYLSVDGKPYVIFYEPELLLHDLGSPAKVRSALDAMRERARRAGLTGIHFAACARYDVLYPKTLREAGFDSFTAYCYARLGPTMEQGPYGAYMLAHEAVWESLEAAGPLPYVPVLTMNWDARPWHGPRTHAYFSRNTADFAQALRRLKAHLDSTGRTMALLEAWNEWGEGAYLEPNAEFGFGDVEAIRRVFCEPADWPANVCPDDVGLADKYDLRHKLHLVGTQPGVRSGMELVCRGDRIVMTAGAYAMNGQEYKTPGGEVLIPAIETVAVTDLPMTLVAGEVKSWLGGNRLIISLNNRRNVLPGSYVPASLHVRDAGRPDAQFTAPRDYVVDDMWGAFGLVPGGRLKPGDKVVVSYRISLRRVDALVMGPGGKPALMRGIPSADGPEPSAVPPGTFHIANIYRPFNADDIHPAQVYVLGKPSPPPLVENVESLQPVLAKLSGGRPVTIVCWGDSVTSCGEASSPAKCYVGLLESMLKQQFPSAVIKVVNAGIGGTSTPGRLPNFQKEVLDFHPDVVTLEFVNDMGVPPDQMQGRYTEILNRTRQAGAALVLITPHFTMPSMMGLADARGADPRPNVAFLRRFARENQVPLADAARRWDELEHVGVPYEILLRNGINHPDDRGHLIFAEELVRLFGGPAPSAPSR